VPERGLGAEDAIITLWRPEAKLFAGVSKPGGEPLGK